MTAKIYGFEQSTYVRTVRMACVEKGVDYELVSPGPDGPASLKTPEHLARHPFGRMPTFEDDRISLFESTAICRYVDEAYDGPPLQPADVVERARMNAWASAIKDYVVQSAISDYVFHYIFLKTADGQPDRDAIEAGKPALRANLEIFERALEGRTFLAGDHATIADLLLVPPLHYVGNMPDGMPLFDGLENLGRWWGAMMQLESFEATLPPLIAEQRKAS